MTRPVRILPFAVLFFGVWTHPSDAQVPPAPAGAADALVGNEVDQLLDDWQASTKGIDRLYAVFTRVSRDEVFHTTEEAKGEARYAAPNQARMDMEGKNPEHFVVPGDGTIWRIRERVKQVEIHHLDVKQQDVLQEGPLPFLFGTDRSKAKARYEFDIVSRDENFAVLKIVPRRQQDRQDFVEAQVTLKLDTYLPTELVYRERNANVNTYRFTQVFTNKTHSIDFSAGDFAISKSQFPQGPRQWTVTDFEDRAAAAPAAAQPR